MIIVGLNGCIINEEKGLRQIDGGGVCVYKDGEVLNAITEERLSLTKYDGGFKHSLPYVLEASNLTKSDVDLFVVSFYGIPFEVPVEIMDEISSQLNLESHQRLISMPSHHLSHAHSAYFTSSYNSSLIVIADNEGQIIGSKKSDRLIEHSCERNSYYFAYNNEIKLIDRDFDYPHGLAFGKLYNKFTRYLGLGNYHNAGKTMGLASYGSGRFDDIGDAWNMDHNGNLHCIVQDSGDTEKDIMELFHKLKVDIPLPRKNNEPVRQIHADMAEYIQKQLEKWSVRKVEYLLSKLDTRNICVGGGVALNCLMNSAILKHSKVDKVFVPSAPLDQGLCIGNAIYGAIEYDKSENIHFDLPLYLGKKPKNTATDLKNILSDYPHLATHHLSNPPLYAAELIAEGKVIAWFQDNSEFGPRALGNRSILADPRDKLVVNRLNMNIKKRELFRPFAPSVLEEYTDEYFIDFSGTSPSMMFIANVKKDKKELLSAITHVDGTARLQTVSESNNKKYYQLIKSFGEVTGIYMVLNTSFNIDGIPIVETVKDAISCFDRSTLDALIINDSLIVKNI